MIGLLLTLAVIVVCCQSFQVLHGAGSARSQYVHDFSCIKAAPAGVEREVVVVGSGISGSTAAFYLQKKGIDVLVAEARNEVGGSIISKKADGYQWEEGPNSFQPSPAILRFAKDLGMIDKLVLADGNLPRFVYWDDKLFKLPGGLSDLPTFDLLSCQGKLRAGLGMLGLVEPKPSREESVKEFVERHLGSEVFERIVDPFVSGVYAGDPSRLGMKSALGKIHGLEGAGIGPSLLGGALARLLQTGEDKKRAKERNADLPKVPTGSLGSFRDGLQSLPNKVRDILGERVQVSHKLVKVVRDGDSKHWTSTFETPDGTKIVRSKALVVTSPSLVTAEVLGNKEHGVLPQAAELARINCPPVASVTVAYPNSAFKVPVKGFGHLIPRSMKVRTLGSIWTSSLFPGRAPPGYTMLTNFIGGAQDTGIVDLSQEQVVAQVHADLQRILLKPGAPPPRLVGYKLWARAIPQYEIGHTAMMERLDRGLLENPGLFLGGNYRTGVALGDCVQFGVTVAEQIGSYLDSM